jgi:hypothetical protein
MMGACDAGRCCKGNACTEDKKCCCKAKKGTHTVGEVCRTASCQRTNGTCDNNVNVCECIDSGGTLSQSCDPCANKVCDAKACKHCVNGECVSFCTPCQNCDSSGIVGVCVPKTCGPCESCISGLCVPYGDQCGFPATCCNNNECCVNGVCVPKACPSPCSACQNCICGQCVLKPSSQCNTSANCTGGGTCVNCQCVPPACCVAVPGCGPHGILVIEGSFTCETVTYDYMGTPCTETRYPLDCADTDCIYQWDGSSWAFEGCAVTTTQGRLFLSNDTCCTSAGCPGTLSAPPGTLGDRLPGVSCENPLP